MSLIIPKNYITEIKWNDVNSTHCIDLSRYMNPVKWSIDYVKMDGIYNTTAQHCRPITRRVDLFDVSGCRPVNHKQIIAMQHGVIIDGGDRFVLERTPLITLSDYPNHEYVTARIMKLALEEHLGYTWVVLPTGGDVISEYTNCSMDTVVDACVPLVHMVEDIALNNTDKILRLDLKGTILIISVLGHYLTYPDELQNPVDMVDKPDDYDDGELGDGVNTIR